MTKLLSMIAAAMFAAVSVSAIAASHAGAQDKGKKPSAEECKNDPKMKGCDDKKGAMKKGGKAPG